MSNHGGAAFPNTIESGMTLRDYFAAAVATGIVAVPINGNNLRDPNVRKEVARHAYQMADALIEERNASGAKPPLPLPV